MLVMINNSYSAQSAFYESFVELAPRLHVHIEFLWCINTELLTREIMQSRDLTLNIIGVAKCVEIFTKLAVPDIALS